MEHLDLRVARLITRANAAYRARAVVANCHLPRSAVPIDTIAISRTITFRMSTLPCIYVNRACQLESNLAGETRICGILLYCFKDVGG
jgi:hypothetical protein